jgi:phosphoribosylformylglycinamidine synthase
MKPRVAVVQFPGSNCEEETLRAVLWAGMDGEIFRWSRPPKELAKFAGYILPGGFAHQDRIRAGAVAAKEPIMDVVVKGASGGKPVLGICNGAQVLVECGLIPGLQGAKVEMALATNLMLSRLGFYHRLVYIKQSSNTGSNITNQLVPQNTLIPIPIAHAEGRFVTADAQALEAIERGNLSSWQYVDPEGNPAQSFPHNPNGAFMALAGLANPAGNVVALMPHPERICRLWQVPLDLPGEWGIRRRTATDWKKLDGEGPGMMVFRSFAHYLEK